MPFNPRQKEDGHRLLSEATTHVPNECDADQVPRPLLSHVVYHANAEAQQWEHALTPPRHGELAGLPPAAWARVFAYHFAAPSSQQHTSPLRICKDLYLLAMVALYTHPRVGHAGITGLEAALRQPLPPPMGGTRAKLVHTLEVWPTGTLKRACEGELLDMMAEGETQDTQHDILPIDVEMQTTEMEGLKRGSSHHAARLAERLATRHTPANQMAVEAQRRPYSAPVPPPPVRSSIHPRLPALLSLLSLDHLALRDVYIPNAASARVLLAALASTTPRAAEIELRMWPAELTVPVGSRTLPCAADATVVHSVLDGLVPTGAPNYGQYTPAPASPEAERQRAWLAAVMTGQRFDTAAFAGPEAQASATHAMLLQWLAGLYAATKGLDWSARAPLPRIALDRHALKVVQRDLEAAGTAPPDGTFGPFTEAQQAARDAYAAFAKDAIERANEVAQAPLRLIHEAVEAGIRAPFTLAPNVAGEATFAPSSTELEALLKRVNGRVPLTAAEALRAIASAFITSAHTAIMEIFPALGFPSTTVEAFDPNYPIFADETTPAPPAVVPDLAPDPTSVSLPPSPPHRLNAWSGRVGQVANPPDLEHVPNGPRPLAWLANCIPIVSHTAAPLLLDAEGAPGVAYILRERIAEIFAAWGRGDVSKEKEGDKLFPSGKLCSPLTENENEEQNEERSEQKNEERKVGKNEERVCSRLTLIAADPQAAQVFCAADRSLWPCVGIESVTVELPPSISPLAALGEPDILTHPGGKGLLHHSTKSFELRVSANEWEDELWLAGYLPPEVGRVPTGNDLQEAETLDEWGGGEGEGEGGGEGESENDREEDEEDEEDEEEWDSGDSDYIDVDEDELAPDFDGAPGESFDSAAAATQAARIAARA